MEPFIEQFPHVLHVELGIIMGGAFADGPRRLLGRHPEIDSCKTSQIERSIPRIERSSAKDLQSPLFHINRSTARRLLIPLFDTFPHLQSLRCASLPPQLWYSRP